jgi:cell wall-associated NlpC family hydrolase
MKSFQIKATMETGGDFMKKFSRIVSMTAIAMSLSVTSTALAASEGIVERSVNFRSAPSTSSKVYDTLSSGTTFRVIDTMNKYWTKVSVDGRVGYVSDHYIRLTSTAASSDKPSTVKASTKADRIIQHAKSLQGVTKYAFGVNQAPYKLDCSSFTKYVFGKEGVSLKWGTRYQKNTGNYVKKASLKKGDLVFFWTSRKGSINHVGIYIGNGQFIHNSPSANGVQISSLQSGYWDNHYVSARRVL